MENRHNLAVDCRVTLADGYGERDAAQELAAEAPGAHRKTIGADKNHDTKGFVAEMRRLNRTAHVAQNTARSGGFAIDGRTTRGCVKIQLRLQEQRHPAGSGPFHCREGRQQPGSASRAQAWRPL